MNGMGIEQAKSVYRLACTELRGGNHLAAYSAALPGLAGWVSCRPLDPSPRGGDLYYMSACSQGVMARVVLADVAGHGEPVSAAAASLSDALRQHVDHWDQSALIRQLNDSFLNAADRGRFATAFVASYYSGTGELLFTNAGHLPPLWYRAGTREWKFMTDDAVPGPPGAEAINLPLGLIAGTAYTQTAVQIEPGDILLLYTDGVSEARDESGAQLGLDRLLAMARTLPTESAAAAGKGLLAVVGRYRGAEPAADDETVVALQREGT